MYHIFLTADEKYVKFSSVLMSSIIKNATQDYERRPFCFHILSDFISDTTKEKLKILQKSLSEIYPCEIKIHIQAQVPHKIINYPIIVLNLCLF